MRGCFRVIFTCHLTITLLHSYPLESAFIETYMVGLTLPAAEAHGKVRRAQFLKIVFFGLAVFSFGVFLQDDLFPSPEEIASEKHKRYWVNNNHMVRGQLILSHKWMLFLPSHVPAQNAQNAQVVEFQFSRIFDLISTIYVDL